MVPHVLSSGTICTALMSTGSLCMCDRVRTWVRLCGRGLVTMETSGSQLKWTLDRPPTNGYGQLVSYFKCCNKKKKITSCNFNKIHVGDLSWFKLWTYVKNDQTVTPDLKELFKQEQCRCFMMYFLNFLKNLYKNRFISNLWFKTDLLQELIQVMLFF